LIKISIRATPTINCTISQTKSCDGSRLNESARNVFITDYNLSNITKLSIANSYKFFKDLKLLENKFHNIHMMYSSTCTVKPVLSGHLWNKEKVAL
jgi:excinuclease UvrABC ATPase subunit